MADPQTTIQKAAAARECGELWRAKEILQGRLASGGFVPEVHESLGRVLLEMKDRLEAGRHLYASGAALGDTEAQSAVDLFLSRHGKGSPEDLQLSLPAAARRMKLQNLPERVREDLARRGLEPREYPSFAGGSSDEHLGRLVGLLLYLVLGALLLIFGLGILTAVNIVSGWFV